jgi:hypothetical protein
MGDLPTPRATCFRPVASYRLRSAGAQTQPAEIDLKPSSRGADCRAARGGPLHRPHRRESTPLRMRPKPRAVILERRPPPHMSGRSGHAIPHGAGMGVSLRDARGAGGAAGAGGNGGNRRRRECQWWCRGHGDRRHGRIVTQGYYSHGLFINSYGGQGIGSPGPNGGAATGGAG